MSSDILKAYELAKERYEKIGVDTDQVLEELENIKLSIHCWQGDDINGFLFPDQELTGGISVTGDYLGKARNAHELRQDLSKALSLIPGKHKIQLHAIYADTDEKVDLNELEPRHFATWVDWAKEEGVGLDFNGTFFPIQNLLMDSPCQALIKKFVTSGLNMENEVVKLRNTLVKNWISKVSTIFGYRMDIKISQLIKLHPVYV